MLQYRPVDGVVPDKKFYSPERDLVNCGVHILYRAMQRLEDAIRDEKYSELVKETKEELDTYFQTCAEKTGQALNKLVEKNFSDACKLCTFEKIPLHLRTVFLAEIGDAFLDALFVAFKDVTTESSSIPMSEDELVKMLKEIRTMKKSTLDLFVEKATVYWNKAVKFIKQKVAEMLLFFDGIINR
ncbi:MAG: hypothetical protein QW303_01990 [Nitrososphaerota archaeon]